MPIRPTSSRITFTRTVTLLSLIFMVISFSAFSQGAKEYFGLAKKALQGDDATSCIELLKGAERKLGGSNAKIEALKTQAYVLQNDWINARISINHYKRFLSTSNLSADAFQVMKDLETEVTQGLEKLEKDFKAWKEKEAEASLQQISNRVETEDAGRKRRMATLNSGNTQRLNDVMLSSNNEEILHLLVTESPDYASKFRNIKADWEKALRQDTWEAYDAFVTKYPSSLYTDQARRKLTITKNKTFDEFVTKANAYYNSGKYRDALVNYEKAYALKTQSLVHSRILECQDEIVYEETLASKDYDTFTSYLKKYPESRHRSYIERSLIVYHFKKAMTALEKRYVDDFDAQVTAVYEKFKVTPTWSLYEREYNELLLKGAALVTQGKKEFRVKQVGKGIKYLTQANASAHDPAIGTRIKRLEARQRAWTRNEKEGYVAYRRSTLTNVGVEFGLNPNLKYGGFISCKFDTRLATDPMEEFLRNGRDYLQTTINLNFSKRIFHPVWIYIGPGYAEFVKVSPSTTNPDYGYIPEKADKLVGRGINFDAGIILKMGIVNFSLGVSTPYFSKDTKEKLGIQGTMFIPSAAIGTNFVF